MWYEVSDMDSYITWPYQIADHYCRITWVYNNNTNYTNYTNNPCSYTMNTISVSLLTGQYNAQRDKDYSASVKRINCL